jgi:internalin A
MADIYLSYSHQDRPFARQLAQELERYGWTVWWEAKLEAGERFDSVYEKALRTARTILVIWSSLSIRSQYVRDEASYAVDHDKLISTIRDQVRLPLRFAGLPHVDLSGWQGESAHAGFRELIDSLVTVLGLSDTTTIPLPSIFETRGGERPLNEAKLMLVGYGGVGKTSIVNRLVRRRPFDPHEKQTDGISISNWLLPIPRNGEVHLHVWDFGGQEIMHATHQFFLTPRSLYLLVLNGRHGREDVDAEYWLNMVQAFAADSPVIVVLNKIREFPFDVNRRALQGKFPSIRQYVETDCADGSGLDDLERLIQEEMDRLPHVHDVYPANWFVIKDKLQSMRESYLSFGAFRKLCAEYGELGDGNQERLADFLHVLGVALNYSHDPRLHDTHVLKPSWVTEGIYAILNAKRLAASKGELRLSDLSDILDPNQYPPAQHSFLLELMRRFELCFRFPEEDRVLVPDLLDKQEPQGLEGFAAEGLLEFEYHYPGLLPAGLLPRFIVRTSGLSVDRLRWRSGVVLSFEGNRALVKGDSIERKVHITVDGPSRGRRRLLAVIRADFEHIHESYAFRPDEMVPVPRFAGVVIPYQKLLVMEHAGLTEIKETFGDEVLTLKVRELLDGVDLEGGRDSRAGPVRASPPLSAFISYSHKDGALRAELETHLKLLKREGLLDLWTDRHIQAGTEWETQIDENLESADLILLLVSADFVASDYCWGAEMKRAMERHDRGEARVIPIIVRECSWKSAPFARLQALPEDSKPVSTWGTGPYARDTPWTAIEERIRSVVNELRRSNKHRV